MSFREIYQNAIVREGYHKDGAQATTVDYLDSLYAELLQMQVSPGQFANGLSKVFRRWLGNAGIKGVYIWGGVGLGKTWLMDLFFDALPQANKSRFHFHEFMQRIHQELARQKRQRDPLKTIARMLVDQSRLICLDELHVLDITDAMLLHGLLDEMYRYGAVFVMTSNVMPDELYLNGLQRSRFLPAIELIKNRNYILQVEGDRDYRMQKRLDNRNYYCPLSTDTDGLLEERFGMLASGATGSETTVNINNRSVPVRAQADNIVWFDFDAICGGPRATIDYIHIAQQYDVVIISNVFKMDETYDDMARRFINLVDELYDRNTGLILSATGWPADLYSGQRLEKEFERTISRLQEMRVRNLLSSEDVAVEGIDKIARLP
jgi:cell division protein ZapE